MVDQTREPEIAEIQSRNKDRLYQATLKEVACSQLTTEVQNKIKELLKTKSRQDVKRAIALFFSN